MTFYLIHRANFICKIGRIEVLWGRLKSLKSNKGFITSYLPWKYRNKYAVTSVLLNSFSSTPLIAVDVMTKENLGKNRPFRDELSIISREKSAATIFKRSSKEVFQSVGVPEVPKSTRCCILRGFGKCSKPEVQPPLKGNSQEDGLGERTQEGHFLTRCVHRWVSCDPRWIRWM